jgi:prephenate dehydrogenase
MKTLIVGLGLIGGSMAKALTQNTDHKVCGLDRSLSVTSARRLTTEPSTRPSCRKTFRRWT